MSKIFKDEKIFNKFKQDFRFIFKNKNFIDLTQNHFNKNGSFAVFSLAFLQNRVGEQRIFDSAKINYNEWIELFEILYKDEQIKKVQETLALNPLIPIENIKQNFSVFNNFIDKLLSYIKEQNWSLNIEDELVKQLFKSAFGYILYNSIECKLYLQLKDIIEDKHYDDKFTIILNNTKLFSDVKKDVRNTCGQKINDLIVILLGGSNHLALDK